MDIQYIHYKEMTGDQEEYAQAYYKLEKTSKIYGFLADDNRKGFKTTKESLENYHRTNPNFLDYHDDIFNIITAKEYYSKILII